MIAIIVRKSGVVISKEVYQGDLSKIAADLANRQSKDATLTFQQFADDQDPTYLAAAIPAPAIDTAWAVAKAAGGATALAFLAKKLGLE